MRLSANAESGAISAIISPRRTKRAHRQWLYPNASRSGRYLPRAHLCELGAARDHVRRAVRAHQRQPAAAVNFVERKFSILGQIFWPQDMIIFAVALLLFFTGIIVFTAAFGRLWCGWTCPQTVLMEMVFRKIEYFIEGDATAQRALDAAPWTAAKIWSKSLQARHLFRALVRHREHAARLHHRHRATLCRSSRTIRATTCRA